MQNYILYTHTTFDYNKFEYIYMNCPIKYRIMSEEICVQIKSLEGEIIVVLSHTNNTLRDLISKVSIKEDINSLQIIINDSIYNLENDGSKTLSEMQIKSFSLVTLSKSQLSGTVPFIMDFFRFNNFESKIKLKLSSGPYFEWHVVREGISFIGICENTFCKAYKQNVYCTLGFGKFDIRTTLQENVVCPMCKSNMISNNFGFLMAQWKIKGIIKGGKKVKIFDKADEREYYTTFREGTQNEWQYLKVNVKRLDE